jgi:hypothetical protein
VEELRREIGNGQVGAREEWEQPDLARDPEAEEPEQPADGPEPAVPDMAEEIGGAVTLAIRVFSFGELRKRRIPQPKYLMKPFIIERAGIMLAAWRGVGKTWTGFNIAGSLAGGIPLLGACPGYREQ